MAALEMLALLLETLAVVSLMPVLMSLMLTTALSQSLVPTPNRVLN